MFSSFCFVDMQLLSAIRGAFDNNYNGGGNEGIHVPVSSILESQYM